MEKVKSEVAVELSFYSEPWGVFEQKLKGFSNTVIVGVDSSISQVLSLLHRAADDYSTCSLLSEVGK